MLQNSKTPSIPDSLIHRLNELFAEYSAEHGKYDVVVYMYLGNESVFEFKFSVNTLEAPYIGEASAIARPYYDDVAFTGVVKTAKGGDYSIKPSDFSLGD